MKTLIIVTDKNGGISFNGRRICWDPNVREWLKTLSRLCPLVAESSAKAYLGDNPNIEYVDRLMDSIQKKASDGYYLADKTVEPAMFLNCDRVIIFTLDKVLPSDKSLCVPLESLSLECIWEESDPDLGYSLKEYKIVLVQSYRQQFAENCRNFVNMVWPELRLLQSSH